MMAALICFGAIWMATAVRAETPMGVFTYAIHTDDFGKVGEFTNVVRREGASIIVESRTEIAVKLFFLLIRDTPSEEYMFSICSV